MLENLEAYLDAFATQEQRDLILEASQVLLDSGIDSHLFLLRNAIDEADASGDFDSAHNKLVGILVPNLQQQLREFGIKVIEEAELHVMLSLFKAVMAIENWEDRTTINALADGEEDPETLLSDIAEIVGDLPSSEYQMILESVSPDLLDRITTLTETPVVVDTTRAEQIEASRMRTLEFLNRVQMGEDSFFIQAMAEGMQLAKDFHQFIEPHLPQILELSPSACARELVAFAMASSLPTEEIHSTINDMKESFHFSIIQLIELEATLRSLLGEN